MQDRTSQVKRYLFLAKLRARLNNLALQFKRILEEYRGGLEKDEKAMKEQASWHRSRQALMNIQRVRGRLPDAAKVKQ